MALERVKSEKFPYLPLRVAVGERTVEIMALLDTGFDGDLIVPQTLVASDGGRCSTNASRKSAPRSIQRAVQTT